MEEQFAQEKERLIAKLSKDHEQEIALLRQAHTAILSETKRKQWVSKTHLSVLIALFFFLLMRNDWCSA